MSVQNKEAINLFPFLPKFIMKGFEAPFHYGFLSPPNGNLILFSDANVTFTVQCSGFHSRLLNGACEQKEGHYQLRGGGW